MPIRQPKPNEQLIYIHSVIYLYIAHLEKDTTAATTTTTKKTENVLQVKKYLKRSH